MAQTRIRLEQEVARLGGHYAHVLDEIIDARRDEAKDEAWLQGFFTYTNGKKGGVDPAIYPLLGIQPNGGIPTAEIVQRLTYAMLNEAARAVGDGVVRTPRDGDIGAIYGFGFPPFRGGPLRYLDDLGADRLFAELQRLAERLGPRFTPCEVIVEQARGRTRFYP